MGDSSHFQGFGAIEDELDLGDEPVVPAPASSARSTLRQDQPQQETPTRMASIDEALQSAVARGDIGEEDIPQSYRSGRAEVTAPSASGVATRNDRVAAMRELYAQGDATGALMLASDLTTDGAPKITVGVDFDHPDASVELVVGEEMELEEVADDDPFGGLIPIDDRLPPTAPPPQSGEAAKIAEAMALEMAPLSSRAAALRKLQELTAPVLAPAAPTSILTLTERHTVPRLLKDPSEVARLPIDPRSAFLLAHVDAVQTLEEILDVCAMPPAQAIELLRALEKLGVIAFE